MIEDNCFENNEIIVNNIVILAAHFPTCLPHIVDFITKLKQTNCIHENLCDNIILGIIDSYAEQQIALGSIENIITFFIESSSHKYNICQPRVSDQCDM